MRRYQSATARAAVVISLWCLLPSPAAAQPGPAFVPCLDAMVLNAKYVFVGRIVEVRATDAVANVVVAVEKRLKGVVSDTTGARIAVPAATLEDWRARASRLLIVNVVSEGMDSAIDLSAPDLGVLRADMTVLRDADSVIRSAEDTIRRHPGVFGISTVRRTVPAASAALLPPRDVRFYMGPSAPIETGVPVDDALERWALQAIESRDVRERAEGVGALWHFPSDANIARLMKLLEDPGLVPTQDGPIYLVRLRAYEALRQIGVKVPEPPRRP